MDDKSFINQKIAANPNLSVWVSASAGTGKTTVLVNRLLRLFLNSVDPSKILCLTYTKAGAMNMQNRIYAQTELWATMPEQELKTELIKLFENSEEELSETSKEFHKIFIRARKLFSTLIDSALPLKIYTIHAFCTSILKRFPIEAGIPPHFNVVEGDEAKKILQDSYQKLISKIKNNCEDIFLIESFDHITNIVSEMKIDEVTKDIIGHREHFFNITKKYRTTKEIYDEIKKILFSGFDNEVKKYIIDDELFNKTNLSTEMFGIEYNYLYDIINNISPKFIDDFNKILSSDITKTNSANASNLNTFTELTTIEEKIQKFSIYSSIFLTKPPEKLKKISSILSKKSLLSNSSFETDILVEGERILHALTFIKLMNIYRSTIAIMNIGLHLNDIYMSEKKQQNVMDFTDLITFVEKLFSTPNICEWILYKLDGGVSHILIDEAQDTSPLQWKIVDSLTDEFFTTARTKDDMKSVFTVGDRKQSIFSFQGANINLFEKYRSHFKQKITENKFDFRDLPLNRSFRSCKNILNTVDNVIKYTTGISINNEEIIHIANRKDSDGYIELIPLIKKLPDTISDCFKPPVEHIKVFNSSIEMANILATKIRYILDNNYISCGKKDGKKYIRKAEPKDIMILVRNWKSADYVVKTLTAKNISVSSMDTIALSDNIAIQDLLSLLKFVLFPYDDLSLAEVLKSPLYNLSDDDLLVLCYERGEKTLYTRLSEELKYKNIYNDLENLVELSTKTLPFAFFDYIIKVQDKRRNFIKRFGTEVNDVLDGFLAQCLEYDNLKIAKSLANFYEWFQLSEVEIKNDIENSSNKVRIMTVHGSKGLEAPIVFLYNANTPYKLHEAPIIWDDDFPIYKVPKFKYINKTCDTIYSKVMQENQDEFFRLLYVAMTRAKDKLYVIGMDQGKQKKSNDENEDAEDFPATSSWYSFIKTALEHNPNATKIIDKSLLGYAQSFSEQEDMDEKSMPFSLTLGNEDEQGEIIVVNKNNLKKNISIPKYLFEQSPTPTNDFVKINTVVSPLSAFTTKNEDELFSIQVDDENFELSALNRGTMIHKLLDYLTKYGENIENPNDFIFNYISQTNLSDDDKDNLTAHISSIYNSEKFKFLFHNDNLTEVELAIRNSGSSKTLRMDNLCIKNNEVLIIDYKTDKNTSSEIPEEYIQQLSAYKHAISKIYPTKKINAAILWIETETLQIL